MAFNKNIIQSISSFFFGSAITLAACIYFFLISTDNPKNISTYLVETSNTNLKKIQINPFSPPENKQVKQGSSTLELQKAKQSSSTLELQKAKQSSSTLELQETSHTENTALELGDSAYLTQRFLDGEIDRTDILERINQINTMDAPQAEIQREKDKLTGSIINVLSLNKELEPSHKNDLVYLLASLPGKLTNKFAEELINSESAHDRYNGYVLTDFKTEPLSEIETASILDAILLEPDDRNVSRMVSLIEPSRLTSPNRETIKAQLNDILISHDNSEVKGNALIQLSNWDSGENLKLQIEEALNSDDIKLSEAAIYSLANTRYPLDSVKQTLLSIIQDKKYSPQSQEVARSILKLPN